MGLHCRKTAFRLRSYAVACSAFLPACFGSSCCRQAAASGFLNTTAALTILIGRQAIFPDKLFSGIGDRVCFPLAGRRATHPPWSRRPPTGIRPPAGEEHLMAFDTPNRMTRLPASCSLEGIAQHR